MGKRASTMCTCIILVSTPFQHHLSHHHATLVGTRDTSIIISYMMSELLSLTSLLQLLARGPSRELVEVSPSVLFDFTIIFIFILSN